MPRIDRRQFVIGIGAAGAGAALGAGAAESEQTDRNRLAELAVIRDSRPEAAAERAIASVIGSSGLVGRSSRVLVNANTSFRHPGTIVRPEVLIEVLRRCWSDGASRVELAKDVPDGYWDPVFGNEGAAELIKSTPRCPSRMIDVPIPGSEKLGSARCLAAMHETDHLVNVSIAKDHTGVRFSGALKNAMGLTAFRPTNRFCHKGSDPERVDTDVAHLAACIAELNLLRRPDLHVLDATEFLTTNGPYGPGKIGRADLVIAGFDPVAVDVRAMGVVGRGIPEVPVIGEAVRYDLGAVRSDRELTIGVD